MNEYQRRLMSAPSLTPGWCIACGAPYPTAHHVVPRSQGGKDGPCVHLCGSGSTGCHGAAEDRTLHLDYRDGWYTLTTPRPMKFEKALLCDGWRKVGA